MNCLTATDMVRFNTAFLLKATIVVALVCLPMTLDEKNGYGATAFLLPISFAILAATQVEKRGDFEFRFKKLPNAVVEVNATGGRQGQWLTQCRLFGVGLGLSFVTAMTASRLSDASSPKFAWSFAAFGAACAMASAGLSVRRRILVTERRFVTEFLMFGRLHFLTLRWQVREGDYLTVFAVQRPNNKRSSEFDFQHMLCICRPRRRHVIAIADFTQGRAVQGMEIAGRRVAKLVDLPFVGYREWKGFWWLW